MSLLRTLNFFHKLGILSFTMCELIFNYYYNFTNTDILLEKVIIPAFITRLIVVWMVYILGAIFYHKNRPTASPLPQLPNVDADGILAPLDSFRIRDITFELKGIESPDVDVHRKNTSVMFCTKLEAKYYVL